MHTILLFFFLLVCQCIEQFDIRFVISVMEQTSSIAIYRPLLSLENYRYYFKRTRADISKVRADKSQLQMSTR